MREAVVNMSDNELAEMGLKELVAYTRQAGIHKLEELTCHGNGGVMQLEVKEKLDGDRLAKFESVSQWEFVAEKDELCLYLIEVIAPELTDDSYGTDLIGTCDPSLTEHGATMELVGPQQTISKALREYEEAGISVELANLSDYEGSTKTFDVLTDRQLEVIQTAYNVGFYEIPREASTEDIAIELNIDTSTVAEHLQRAVRNLLSQQLSAQ